jgi:hypothetical protein
MPGGITPVVVLHYLGRVFDEFTAKKDGPVIEVHPYRAT